MLMVHSAMAAMTGAGLSGGRTYAEWLAHIAGRAPTAPAASSSAVSALSLPAGASLRRVQMTPGTTGGMAGSSFFENSDQDAYFNGPSALRRIIQHGLPSEAEFVTQQEDSRIVLAEFRRASNNGTDFLVYGQDRNGFLSSAFNIPATGTTYYQIGAGAGTWSGQGVGASVGVSYWDAALGRPMSFFPRETGAQRGPFDYAAAGW